MDGRESCRRGSGVLRIVHPYIACGRSSRLRTEHCPLGLMAKQFSVPFAEGHWRPLSSPWDVLTQKIRAEAEITQMINDQISNL